MVASIARNSPIGAIFVSYIWGILKAGSLQLERITSNNRLVVNIVQALFVLMVSVDSGRCIKRSSAAGSTACCATRKEWSADVEDIFQPFYAGKHAAHVCPSRLCHDGRVFWP